MDQDQDPEGKEFQQQQKMSELNFQNTEIKCNGKSREEEDRQQIVLFDPYFCFLSSVYTSGTGFFCS